MKPSFITFYCFQFQISYESPSRVQSAEKLSPILEPLSPPTPTTPEKKKKKKDKKRKDKERNRRSFSGTPPPSSTRDCNKKIQNLSLSELVHKKTLFSDSPSAKHNADDQGLSESELESRRAALLAQLNMQMDE